METVIIRKTGGNSIGFEIDPIILKKFNAQPGDFLKISLLQILKPNSLHIIKLENISFVKKLTAGNVIVIKSNLAKAINIEPGDVISIIIELYDKIDKIDKNR